MVRGRRRFRLSMGRNEIGVGLRTGDGKGRHEG